jgi:uncharacterized membrane protein
MEKIALTILETAFKVQTEAGRTLGFSRRDLQDMVLSSGTGWANRAITFLVQGDYLLVSADPDGSQFILSRKGREAAIANKL